MPRSREWLSAQRPDKNLSVSTGFVENIAMIILLLCDISSMRAYLHHAIDFGASVRFGPALRVLASAANLTLDCVERFILNLACKTSWRCHSAV